MAGNRLPPLSLAPNLQIPSPPRSQPSRRSTRFCPRSPIRRPHPRSPRLLWKPHHDDARQHRAHTRRFAHHRRLRMGDVLYLTGQAKNLVGEEAEDVMPFQSVLTTIHVTGFVFIKDALPVRQQPLADKGPEGVEYSPYSPPVRPLKEELEAQGLSLFASSGSDGKPTALLKRIQFVSENIAIFTFTPSVPIDHKPGQYIILDWRSFLGERQYRHMSPTSPTSLNDDFIRTWTISSFAPSDSDSSPTKANDFQLTIRYQPGGAVTGPLFTMARKIQQTRPELLDDLTSLAIRPRIPGISGEFTLDLPRENEIQSGGVEGPRKLVWAAGGIGITPFLSMLRSIVHHSRRFPAVKWDILFLLSTREPEILVPLVIDACGASPDDLTNVTIQLHVFFTKGPETPVVPDNTPSWLSITHHPTRVTPQWLRSSSLEFKGREPYVCGAPPYEKTIMDSLTSDEVGISKDAVKSEWFAF
ncbi:oxidoreductase FAD/NAD(P)-binding protein [Coprinopsis cinerea AmutBmut pab1-1]|nr:oxidoreductase FAD/NAD(P)-binding protein [Coprinopsis cinerea AmutBmut pab1-1]